MKLYGCAYVAVVISQHKTHCKLMHACAHACIEANVKLCGLLIWEQSLLYIELSSSLMSPRAPLHLHLLHPRELQPLPEVHPVLLSGAHCVPQTAAVNNSSSGCSVEYTIHNLMRCVSYQSTATAILSNQRGIPIVVGSTAMQSE